MTPGRVVTGGTGEQSKVGYGLAEKLTGLGGGWEVNAQVSEGR